MAFESTRNDPFLPDCELHPAEIPEGVDRRAFMMRSALTGATAVLTGCTLATPQQQADEIPANRRVDFDTTVNAMALTVREMNAKYKETSEGAWRSPWCSARRHNRNPRVETR
jgi:hypothetical protein